MASRRRAAPGQVHELRIALQGSKPPIWRRVALRSDTRLSELHLIIQVVMGWLDAHLHQFVVPIDRPKPRADELGALVRAERWDAYFERQRRARCLSDPAFELDEAEDEHKARLDEIAPAVKSRFTYEYDFGDGWEHRIEVKKIGPPAQGVDYPVCLAGKLACPPEDCGGIWGYYELLDAMQNPKHQRHEEVLDWLGGEFDPERFERAEVNALLAESR